MLLTDKLKNQQNNDLFQVKTELVESISQINSKCWNRCVSPNFPFLRHEFLSALEDSGCVSSETGWEPKHIVLRKIDKSDAQVLGVLPLYQKSHSWGEFIFDWDWAGGHHQFGLKYYPKLVSQSPFTPISAPKLLIAPGADSTQTRLELVKASQQLAEDLDVSSSHWLFTSQEDMDTLSSLGLICRSSTIEYVWKNQDYDSMEAFIGTLSSRKRKKIRKERKTVVEQNIKVEAKSGIDMTPNDWLYFEYFYRTTIAKYGSNPYLSYEFFRMIGESMPQNIVAFQARLDGDRIAGSLCLLGDESLYGRYWGTLQKRHCLHFETCYYAAIEYCIDNGLKTFNAGVQGEHKLSRGFYPHLAKSAHSIRNPLLSAALENYVQREASHYRAYQQSLKHSSPFVESINH